MIELIETGATTENTVGASMGSRSWGVSVSELLTTAAMIFRGIQRLLLSVTERSRRAASTHGVGPTEARPVDGLETDPPTALPASQDAATPVRGESALREAIKHEVHVLLDQLPASLRSTDAPAVFGALADDMDTMIRQPPFAAQQALAVSRNANCSVGDLERLFERDPGLTQALLRHANSAYYGGQDGSCLSLRNAIQRIGTAGVENVVLATMVQTMLCRPGGSYDALVQQVWSHMVRTGPIARDLAPAFDVEPEQAFALALLHDAGKLVLFDRISTFRKVHKREVNVPHHLLLWALKRLHELTGGLAALRWGLDVAAVRAIATHHREPPPEHEDRLSEVIFLAEKWDLAEVALHPFDLDALWTAGRLSGHAAAVRAILDYGDRAAA